MLAMLIKLVLPFKARSGTINTYIDPLRDTL